MNNFLSVLQKAKPEQQKTLFRSLIDKIILPPDRDVTKSIIHGKALLENLKIMSLKMKGSNDHMEQPIRVAIYARVSTEEQAEFGYSIDAQLDTLRSYCNLYNKQIIGEYVDRGVSGKSIQGRYELQRLLKDAKGTYVR